MHFHPDCLEIISRDSLFAIFELFNEFDSVLFWIKDRDRRIIALNDCFAQCVRRPVSEVLGKTDSDLYFPELANVFASDDMEVIQSGRLLRRKAELLTTAEGAFEWRSTTKLPLRDSNGCIVGTTGISRPLLDQDHLLPAPYRALSQVIEYIRENIEEKVSVQKIAKHTGMSLSTLNRWFEEHLETTPSQFILQVRMARACRLLLFSPLNMTEISSYSGYESPAAFSRAFRRQMGTSPRTFRKKRGALSEGESKTINGD